MKKVMMLMLCMLVGSGSAFAACQTATITASTPTVDFTVNGNGTVTHKKTGLMWKRCSEGQTWTGSTCTGAASTHIWKAALQRANASIFLTHTDWRLPNIKELISITEDQCSTPSINASIFPATVSSLYWSASPFAGNATSAWVGSFNFGNGAALVKSNNHYVRLVRGGQ